MPQPPVNHNPLPHGPSSEGPPPTFHRYFTAEQANNALVLVSRIVGDITARFGDYLRLRSEVEESSAATAQADKLSAARDQLRDITDELAALQEELTAVGCLLKDWQRGLVDFPARMDGRDVWLCWKLGEPTVSFWHEVNSGFADRQPLDREGSSGAPGEPPPQDGEGDPGAPGEPWPRPPHVRIRKAKRQT